jgi:hypothetical protein
MRQGEVRNEFAGLRFNNIIKIVMDKVNKNQKRYEKC